MIKEVSIVLKPQEENDEKIIFQSVLRKLSEMYIRAKRDEITLVKVKKSLDARHGQVKICLRYKVYIDEKPENPETEHLPIWKKVSADSKKVVIVGFGPAGMFGALRLLESGVKPIIIERGAEVHQRKKDIAAISREGEVDSDSNYCFGEGGAGTFSDGKLYTRSNKRGNIARILQIFVNFGADKSILTTAHPHIGTDKLPKIIEEMRSKIIELGGEIHFDSKFTDFIFDDFAEKKSVRGIIAENLETGEKTEIECDAVMLATGHSANDVYEILAKNSPSSLEAKTFATGVRVEHPRELIDAIQYHGQSRGDILPTAEYKLTTQVDGRGVYSFCMCPGGFVVPSATGPNEIVINGMSPASRGSKWSNAAIVVETRPEDIPENFKEKAKTVGCEALAGIFYRTSLEEQTKKHGQGQKAPAQRLSDFLDKKDSTSLPPSSYTPGLVASRLDLWMPPFIKNRLAKAFKDFNKNMKGFICPDALLIASETRTSTPVRILRDKETLECVGLKNVFPSGEGSGYSGGIVSSAMDGENVCSAIVRKFGK